MEQHRLIPLGRVEEITQQTANMANTLNNLRQAANNLSEEFAGLAHDEMADTNAIYEFRLYKAREQNKRAFYWDGNADERPNLAPLPLPGLQQLPEGVQFPITAYGFVNLTVAQYRALLQAYGRPDGGNRIDLMLRLQRYILGV